MSRGRWCCLTDAGRALTLLPAAVCVLAVAEVRCCCCCALSSQSSAALWGKKRPTDYPAPLTVLAHRLTDKPATERSHEKPPEPVKVSQGLLWDFNARKDTKKEVRGSCRRPQRELLPRISTWEGLARGASSATNYF